MRIDLLRLLCHARAFSTAKTFIRDGVLSPLARRRRFARTYATNYWQSDESRSGIGSSLAQTREVRAALPLLLRDLDVRSILDVPCGDFNWMQQIDLTGMDYLGGDIVSSLISSNIERYGNSKRTFIVLDLVTTIPPKADLVLCRDLLVHMPFRDIARALQNIRRSGAHWLLATTFCDRERNEDLETRDWRPLNLERPPLRFPQPQRLIVENCTQNEGLYRDKALGLWSIRDLP